MLYNMLSKGNTTEWFVHGMTTLQASHRNGSTTPPALAKWQVTKPMNSLNGYCAITK